MPFPNGGKEFLPLESPAIEIHIKHRLRQNGSLFDSLRNLFNFTPLLTGAGTLAALLVGLGLMLTIFYSLPETDSVIVKNGNKNISTSTNKEIKSDKIIAQEIPNTNQKLPSEISETADIPALQAPPKSISIKSTKAVKPKTTNRLPKVKTPKTIEPEPPVYQNARKAPALIEDEEEVATLRLTDLLEEVGTR